MDFYPVKAQYRRGEEVWLCLELEKESATCSYERAVVSVFWMERLVRRVEVKELCNAMEICVGAYEEDFADYGVRVVLCGAGKTTVLETAFDVVKEPRRSLRYGFLSDFTTQDADNGAVAQLRKYHINMVQFYDWSYRHDSLVADKPDYEDMMGKRIHLETVKEKIIQAKEYGMWPIAYGAVYAASGKFYETHKDWAFYNSNQEVFRFIDAFYIMNIQEDSPWREHLIGQYREAMEKVGFSGIHMDTYGFPKTAHSRLEGRFRRVALQEQFGSLIDETRQELGKTGEEPYLIFNNVGNWPVADTARHGVDAVYIEVWPPYERYFHIKQLILEARRLVEDKKPVILAAYLEPFRKEDEASATYAARLLTATIVSNGAYHLLLGENKAVLTQGYYGDYSVMSEASAGIMRRYYDFMVRYLNLFYNPELTDVSMTHMGWDNYEYQWAGTDWSAYGEYGKLWVTVRESEEIKLFSFINLCGCSEDYWNKGKKKPPVQKNVTCMAVVEKEVEGIYFTSPDLPDCASRELDYVYTVNEKGRFVKFSVPEVEVWSAVYIRMHK